MADDQLTVFAYLTAEKADRYRQVMRVFLHAKQRFVLHLRPDEVVGLRPVAQAAQTAADPWLSRRPTRSPWR